MVSAREALVVGYQGIRKFKEPGGARTGSVDALHRADAADSSNCPITAVRKQVAHANFVTRHS